MSANALDATVQQPVAPWQRAEALRLAGRPLEAINLLRQSFAVGAHDYRLHEELGIALVQLNRHEEAIGSFLAALELKPDSDEVCNRIGSAFSSRGLIEPAAIWFSRARQLNPTPSKYLYGYGCVLVQLDSREQAAQVFDEWVQAEPDNPVAQHLAAAALGTKTVTGPTPGYVRALFDSCAARFDDSLTKLSYRGPELVLEAVNRAATAPVGGWAILDAGCGTGLVGRALRSMARRLVGVDLSTGMVNVAQQGAVYDELIHSEIVDYLAAHRDEFDIVAAADVLTYFGKVDEFFAHAACALRTGGLVVVVAEALKTDEDFRLNPSGRFSHSRRYLERAMMEAGFDVEYLEEDVMRHEARKPVPSWVGVGKARTR